MSGALPRTRYCSRCLTTFGTDGDRCPNLGCRAARPSAGWGELLEVGDLIDRTYRIHSRLAIGGAGATYLAREVAGDNSEVGPKVAVKVLYAQRDQGAYLRRLATEAQILQGLNHPQIVECRGFVHRTGHSPYLVTRFEEGGSLLDHLRENGALSISVTANLARQICWALETAHRQGVVHRDLKPENVLLVKKSGRDDVPELKVADFGIAKVYGGVGERLTRVGAFVGTPQYASPEQFDGLTPEPAADIYAVGALMVMCLTLRPVLEPGDSMDTEAMREKLLRSLPPRLDLPGIPADHKRWIDDTLGWAMAIEPGDRCDITTFDERLAAHAASRDPGPVRRTIFTPHAHEPGRQRPAIPQDPGVTAPGLPPLATAEDTHPVASLPSTGFGTQSAVPPVSSIPVSALPASAPREVTSSFPAGRLQPPPMRTLTLDTIPAPARRTMGCGIVGIVGMLAVTVAGVGAWLVMRGPGAVPLTHQESDPARRKDWESLAGSLGQRGVAAEAVCQKTNPSARNLVISATVDRAGTLLDLDLLNYAHEPTRACMQLNMQGAAYPRTGTDTVRVDLTLPK